VNHGERIAPVAAAATALATLACCLPVGIAAAAATASVAAVVAEYRVWFLLAAGVMLVLGIVQLNRAQRQCSTRKGGSLAILAISATIVVLVTLFPQVIAAMIAAWLP
jgi:surface polysaccharide O-acyltransferase-like enzyme